jgi:hypothetical protein
MAGVASVSFIDELAAELAFEVAVGGDIDAALERVAQACAQAGPLAQDVARYCLQHTRRLVDSSPLDRAGFIAGMRTLRDSEDRAVRRAGELARCGAARACRIRSAAATRVRRDRTLKITAALAAAAAASALLSPLARR